MKSRYLIVGIAERQTFGDEINQTEEEGVFSDMIGVLERESEHAEERERERLFVRGRGKKK